MPQVVVDVITATSGSRYDDDPTFLRVRTSLTTENHYEKSFSETTHIALKFFHTSDLDLRGDLL
jgi:hypothetical protein